MRKNSGVSMISLVITIIVIIILAAVAFGSSTDTIENANFSNFTNNVAEVQGLLDQQAVTLKGNEGKDGVSRTDAQVYNFLAKGATLLDDNTKYWLTRADASAIGCTELSGDAMGEVIDYELPVIKVSTSGANSVECTYFVTSTGKVFVWPPYIYEDNLYVNGDTMLVDDSNAPIIASAEDCAAYGDTFDFEIDGVEINITKDAVSIADTDAPDIQYANDATSPVGREHTALYEEADA